MHFDRETEGTDGLGADSLWGSLGVPYKWSELFKNFKIFFKAASREISSNGYLQLVDPIHLFFIQITGYGTPKRARTMSVMVPNPLVSLVELFIIHYLAQTQRT